MPYLSDSEINAGILNSYMPQGYQQNKPEERTFGGTLKDIGLSLAKGGVGTVQGAIGLADIVTPGQLGKAVEENVVDLNKAQEYLEEQYTPAQKAANARVEAAQGFLPTLGAMIQNPSTIGHAIVESAPSMVAGGFVGKGLLAANALRSGLAAGAIGEGAVTAGQTAENIRQQTPDKTLSLGQAGAAIGAGIGTSALGAIGGKIASKLGIGDIDTYLASRQLAETSNKGIIRRIVEGGISEGVFEEMPQSMQEQVWMNAATGKDLLEGVKEAGAAGLLTGAAMGGGVNVFTSGAEVDTKSDLTSEEQQLADIDKQISDKINSVKPEEMTTEFFAELNSLEEQRANLRKKSIEAVQNKVQLPTDPDELNRQIMNLEAVSNPNPGTTELLQQLYQQKENILQSPELEATRRIQTKTIEQRNYEKAQEDLRQEKQRQYENIFDLADAVDTLGQVPTGLRQTDMITRQGKPYQRRDYLENYLNDNVNKDDYEIIEVNLRSFLEQRQNELRAKLNGNINQQERLNILQELSDNQFNIDEAKPKDVGYIARLTDDAVDRGKTLWEDGKNIYSSEDAYWNAQQEAIRRQQETPLQTVTDRRVPFEEILPRSNQEAIEGTYNEQERTVPEAPNVGSISEQPVQPAANAKVTTNVEEAPKLERKTTLQDEISARQSEISDLTDELEANRIEQSRLGIDDLMLAELKRDEENLNKSIKQKNTVLGLLQNRLDRDKFEVRSRTEPGQGISLPSIQKMYPNQEVFQSDTGKISVKFKNGLGATFQDVQDIGDGYIQLAIDTGQMDKNGLILGITQGNQVMLHKDYADDRTLWHENKHLLDNLNMITQADNSALTKEFNKLRKAGKLEFGLSTHDNPMRAMEENIANTFAQVMTSREQYRDTALGKFIQKIMDFFDRLLSFGQQTIRGLAREVESGRIYERQVGNQTYQTTVPQMEAAANKWYSTVQKAIDESKMGSAKGLTWLNQIKKYPNIKQAELDWTGLQSYLQEKGNERISQEDLSNWFKEHQVRVEEVVLGNAYQQLKSKTILKAQQILNKYNLNNRYKIDFDLDNFFEFRYKDSDMLLQKTEFKQLQPEAYNEIKLLDQEFENEYEALSLQQDDTKFSRYKESGGSNYKELILTLPGEEKYTKEVHWENLANPIVHVRMQDREVNGEKVLHIEEVQSDWDQDLRKLGEKTIEPITQEQLSRLVYLRKKSWSDDTWGLTDNTANLSQQEKTELEQLENLFTKSEAERNAVERNPFSENSILLAMKRMVRYAAENGYDRIAWSGADVQAGRWGSEVFEWTKNSDGTFNLKGAEQVGGNAFAGMEDQLDDESVSLEDIVTSREDVYDHVADVMARNDQEYSQENFESRLQRITDKIWQQMQESSTGQYAPRVEGMKEFYNKMLPNLLEKEFGKGRWGKAKLSFITDNGLKLPSMNITDRMKSKALREGMPLFKNVGNINSEEFKSWFGKSVAKKKTGEPVLFYHGSPNEFTVFEDRPGTATQKTAAGLGHFFTMDRNYAAGYSKGSGNLIEAYLKMEKPYKMSLDESDKFTTVQQAVNRKNELKAKGYDSIILQIPGAQPIITVFDSNQVKSTKNRGTWDINNPDINFEVRQKFNIPEQEIPQTEYDRMRVENRNIVGKVKQFMRSKGHEVNRTMNKYLGMTSTNLAKIHPMLQAKVRRLDFDTLQRIHNNLNDALPVLEAVNGTSTKKGMSKNDKSDWDWAVKNGDAGKILSLANKYNFTEQYQTLRSSLDQIHKDLIDVGYKPGFVDTYWPRLLKDREGFLQATREISRDPVFTQALQEKANKLNTSIENLDPDVRAEIIGQKIMEIKSGIGGPANLQGRVYDKIPPDLGKYYMDSSASLVQYIYSTAKNIEARKFFGRVPTKISNAQQIVRRGYNKLTELNNTYDLLASQDRDTTDIRSKIKEVQDNIKLSEELIEKYGQTRDFTENIGSYIDELRTNKLVKQDDEATLKDILSARFHERGTSGIANIYKNISLLDTMGSPISALTQIQDLGWSIYVGGLTPRGITNTVRNIAKAIGKRSDITKEDLGIEWIAQEFADADTLSRAVNKVFNITRLNYIDSIGKESLINNSYDNYKVKAKDRPKLFKEIRHMFSSDNETNQVITDLQNNNRDSKNVQFLVFSRLLDFQPASKSEMPEKMLTAGNWRLAYLLKTFTLKQFDIFRRDVWHKLKSGNRDQIIEGLQNMAYLTSIMTLTGAGADELKDFFLGKEAKFEDHVIENFLTLGGANRYIRMQVNREGIGTALGKQILPPFKFIDSIYKDVSNNVTDLHSARFVDSIPVGGKLYYWHLGKGAEMKQSIAEQDFKKEGKTVRQFKERLDNATDKRAFIQANMSEFQTVRRHENMQGNLNKITALINKLEKVPQTENVKRRIDQLESRKEQMYQRYGNYLN